MIVDWTVPARACDRDSTRQATLCRTQQVLRAGNVSIVLLVET